MSQHHRSWTIRPAATAARRRRRSGIVVAALVGAAIVAPSAAGVVDATHVTYTFEDIRLAGRTGGASFIDDAGRMAVSNHDIDLGVNELYSWTRAGGLENIGNLGTADAIFPRGMNAAGQIFGGGSFSASSPYYHSFIWTPGESLVDLGTLGGPSADALAMNDLGAVVGQSATAPLLPPGGPPHAFVWTAATGMVDIGVPGRRTGAVSINNAGTILVTDIDSGASYVLLAGDYATRHPLAGPGTARQINDNGVIVGYDNPAPGVYRTLVWPTLNDAPVVLPNIGGTFSFPVDMNDAGQVVGRGSTPDDEEHGWFWDPNQPTQIVQIPDLGGDESEPRALNELGQVVGYSTLAVGRDEHGYVWSVADGFYDLGLGRANDINNMGQIAAETTEPYTGNPSWEFIDVPLLIQPFVADANGDGIEDVLATGAPGGFSDANAPVPTTGSIVNANGYGITVTDAATPAGVRIVVDGAGTGRARFTVCGFSLQLSAHSDVVVTCGSITVTVAAGEATVEMLDGHATVSIPAGSAAKVTDHGDGSATVDNRGGGAVTVVLDGQSQVVAPLGTRTVTATPPDTVPPTLTCAVAPTFLLHQPGATVTATVSDADSGPASGSVSTPVDTSQVGNRSATLTGADHQGNTASIGCGYSVIYRFEGFSAPIDNLPTVNDAKAGQTIPVKWRISDYYGTGVAAPASFLRVTTSTGSCSANAPFDAVETYSGNSGLQYLGNGSWQFNWKTPKTYAGLCRTMQLELDDGRNHAAGFRFK